MISPICLATGFDGIEPAPEYGGAGTTYDKSLGSPVVNSVNSGVLEYKSNAVVATLGLPQASIKVNSLGPSFVCMSKRVDSHDLTSATAALYSLAKA